MPRTLYLSHLLPQRHPAVYAQIVAACERFGQAHQLVPSTRDIWIRDFMPIPLPDGQLLEYRYDPDYLKDPKEALTRSEPAAICAEMKLQTVKTDLIIDGGNVIMRGQVLIMADKVVKENSGLYTTESLKAKLREGFQVEKVVFIPQDPKDIYGHADSMVRFIDNDSVLVNYYYKDDQSILTPLEKAGLNVGFLDLPGINPEQDHYWPYLNFLQTENMLLYTRIEPRYDAEVLEQFERYFPAYRGRMQAIEMPEVTKKDGALNCISWQYDLYDMDLQDLSVSFV